MSRRVGTSLARYESKASEFNNKFESDYKDCLGVLTREQKQQQSSSEDHTITMRITDVPTLITAPKDAASQQKMLLRTTRSTTPSHSQNSTTEKMFASLSENEIVVTSNRRIDPPTRFEKLGRGYQSSVDTDTTGDDSTLPTFMSVGTGTSSISWENDLQDHDEMFLVSECSVEEREPPLLSLISSEAKSGPKNSIRRGGGANHHLDKETRRQLHYKEKLRLLTDRLTTSSAVERSRKMLSDIMEKGNSNTTEKDLANEEQANGSYKRIFECVRNKLYACSGRICVDEAVVDHEGIIVAYPTKRGFNCRCPDDTGSNSSGDYDGNFSEVSSLTGMSLYHRHHHHHHHRFQAPYRAKHPENEMIQV